MDSARVIIEVVAGLIPERPEPEFTKRWWLTSEQWHHAGDDAAKFQMLADKVADAQTYATGLMMQPHRLNWVRTDWVWL